MKERQFHLEWITPCFCAGARQDKAEIRAPSIRGQLRWWFRVLGGSREEEAEVFGSVAKDVGRASRIVVRVAPTDRGPEWNPPPPPPLHPSGYIYHFANVSGRPSHNKGPGPRWGGDGVVPPGSKTVVTIAWRRPIANVKAGQLFEEALECWLTLGGIGLRLTRGLGTFRCQEYPHTPENLDRIDRFLTARGFEFRMDSKTFEQLDALINRMGGLLKGENFRGKFPAGQKGGIPGPLGSSSPRQTSSVYFRPVLFPDRRYGLVLFEAPAGRVLGRASMHKGRVLEGLKKSSLTG